MLRLKENPVEWFKFTAIIAVVVNLIAWGIHWKGIIPVVIPAFTVFAALLVITLASIRPRWFRNFYRAGMTVSFQVGEILGTVLLILFFFLLVTPLGLFLRMMGKDLLLTRKHSAKSTYWHSANKFHDFNRMF